MMLLITQKPSSFSSNFAQNVYFSQKLHILCLAFRKLSKTISIAFFSKNVPKT